MVPDIRSKVWKDILLKSEQYQFDSLALKVLVSRLRIKVLFEPDPAAIEIMAAELREAFIRYKHLPKVQNDIKKLFEGV